jgi:hypothetical protein
MGRALRDHTRGLDDRIHAQRVRAERGDDHTVEHPRLPSRRWSAVDTLILAAVLVAGLLLAVITVVGFVREPCRTTGGGLAGPSTCQDSRP